jgi:CheY-like chemotaxis protein
LKTILLADDDDNDAVLITRALRQVGFMGQIKTVRDGGDVLGYLSGQGEFGRRDLWPLPDLILIDLRMPGISGVETLRQIQAQPEWRSFPCVVLSGLSDLSEVQRAYLAGARTFFMKPLRTGDAVQICKMVE